MRSANSIDDDDRRVLDTVGPGPIVLVGTSLGAAVALQEAAHDPRVTAVVAAETFSDLRTVATERAPFFFTSRIIKQAFQLAEQQAGFQADGEPRCGCRHDQDSRAAHPRRGRSGNEALRDSWGEVERWLDEVVSQTSG
jgi:pimeloyl-ACP methyl ester carboxylesterase